MRNRLDKFRRQRSDDGGAAEKPERTGTPRALAVARIAGLAAVTGAVVAYFLDPERGRGRRVQTVDRLGRVFRTSGKQVARAGRRVSSNAVGVSQRLKHGRSDGSVPENDAVLAHKVETELFRDHAAAKGRINVNAEFGVVTLRGVAGSPEEITEIESRTRRVDGVVDVRNLLHLPEEPAPTYAGASG